LTGRHWWYRSRRRLPTFLEVSGMTGGRRSPSTIARAGVRGLVAAMAMTGTRTVTAAVGPEEQSPPEAIVDKHAPSPVQRQPERNREAFTELLHWVYGAAGGLAFGLLPGRVRRHPAAGPVYGMVAWLGFELGIAPALGVRRARRRNVLWPALVAADHLLYGVVVAGRLAPEPEVHDERRSRWRR
jgi:hypothetical protein